MRRSHLHFSMPMARTRPLLPGADVISAPRLVCLAAVIWGIVGGQSPTSGAETDRPLRTSQVPPQVDYINRHLRQAWKAGGLEPARPATESEWCRRVYLDVLGRIPTVDELRAFTRSRRPDARAQLVDTLLYSDEYTSEYARNWTTVWSNLLIGRSGGAQRGSLVNREGMRLYLREAFTANQPYDELAYELVTATGSTTPGTPDFNGAVNFLVMKVEDDKAAQATAATARIFLGLQLQCTQCHNHPFNDWKQQKFWEFNSFFRQSRAVRHFAPGTRDLDRVELVNRDFAGEDAVRNPAEAAVYYELRNAQLKVAYPAFIDGTSIPRSGRVSDVDRRQELGRLMLQSEYLDKALVNRYWSHFLGHGFTKPVDDLGPHNTPSHPELLDYLGQQFRQSGYNLKELIRWIALSEAYSLSSQRNNKNRADDPALGVPPQFSHFYLRQMRAEELYESLLVATLAHRTRGGYEEQERAKSRWLAQFVTAFGDDEGTESTTFNGTIPQALTMFNGELIQSATSDQRGSFLWNVVESKTTPAEKVEYLFLASLARKPTRDELAIADKLLAVRLRESPKEPSKAWVAALQDLWWAVLNSNEFILNH